MELCSLLPQEQVLDRDYRLVERLVRWILSLPLDFHGDSAFASESICYRALFGKLMVPSVSKALTMFGIVVDCCWPCFDPLCDEYVNLFIANTDTGYAEVIFG